MCKLPVAHHAVLVQTCCLRYVAQHCRCSRPPLRRLTNSLMMHGRNNGKKLMAVRRQCRPARWFGLLDCCRLVQVTAEGVSGGLRIAWPAWCTQVRIVRHAFEIIALLTDQNPIQVLVDAIING